jgi:membrane protease subunit (stomatin/prohibitin family)
MVVRVLAVIQQKQRLLHNNMFYGFDAAISRAFYLITYTSLAGTRFGTATVLANQVTANKTVLRLYVHGVIIGTVDGTLFSLSNILRRPLVTRRILVRHIR